MRLPYETHPLQKKRFPFVVNSRTCYDTRLPIILCCCYTAGWHADSQTSMIRSLSYDIRTLHVQYSSRHWTTFVIVENWHAELETHFPSRRPSCASPTCSYDWRVLTVAMVMVVIRGVLATHLIPTRSLRARDRTWMIWLKQGGTISGTSCPIYA